MGSLKSKLIKSKTEIATTIDTYIEKGERISQKFTEDVFNQWKSYLSEFLKQVFDNPDNEYKESFDNAGVSEYLVYPAQKEFDKKLSYLKDFKLKLELIPYEVKEDMNTVIKCDSKRIFIVHGHDTALKETVARLLGQLGLEPIILHERQNNGKTIIEKFESNAETCRFAIILLTADDWGYAKEDGDDSKRLRARQNVVFEMGFFMGKLGRDRVFLLLDNDVEKPGDLDGIIYHPTNNETWKYDLVKELKSSGYNVDANKLL